MVLNGLIERRHLSRMHLIAEQHFYYSVLATASDLKDCGNCDPIEPTEGIQLQNADSLDMRFWTCARTPLLVPHQHSVRHVANNVAQSLRVL